MVEDETRTEQQISHTARRVGKLRRRKTALVEDLRRAARRQRVLAGDVAEREAECNDKLAELVTSEEAMKRKLSSTKVPLPSSLPPLLPSPPPFCLTIPFYAVDAAHA